MYFACVHAIASVDYNFVTLWTAACQASLSMAFSMQEYQSGLSLPPARDLPDPGIKPSSLTSPALGGGFFTTSATWEAETWGLPPMIIE